MARMCNVCGHRNRFAIEKALNAQTSVRQVAGTYKLSEDSVGRHKLRHMTAPIAPVAPTPQHIDPIRTPKDVHAEQEQLRADALELFFAAKERADWSQAEKALRLRLEVNRDKAESYGMRGAKGSINLNLNLGNNDSEARVWNAVDGMTEAQLRASIIDEGPGKRVTRVGEAIKEGRCNGLCTCCNIVTIEGEVVTAP